MTSDIIEWLQTLPAPQCICRVKNYNPKCPFSTPEETLLVHTRLEQERLKALEHGKEE